MKVSFENIKSDKSNKLEEYLIISELPSGFRSYNVDKIYIRGLYFIEASLLSEYMENDESIEQLVNLYSDAIKGINIYDLEFIDFQVLVILISILTISDFGWKADIECQNIVDNYKIDDYKFKIKLIKEKLESATEEEKEILLQKLNEFEELIKNAPEKIICGTKITEPITLMDFDFTEPEKVDFKDIHPLFVKDVIKAEDYIQKNNLESQRNFVFIAAHMNGDLDENYKKIIYSKPNEIEKIIKQIDLIDVKLNPIIKKCPRCKHENKIYLSLDDIKVYP